MQYLRGTENLFMDTLIESPEYFKLMEIVEDFYNTYLDEWLKLEVDGIIFGDDWGSQRSLLISPETWRKQYKPLYKRFFDKVHTAGKFVFMHSDGYILELYDDLIEIGVDAINSQVWCMGLDKVAEKCNGRITNWGEICRQHILPEGSVEDVIDAVHKMKEGSMGKWWPHRAIRSRARYATGKYQSRFNPLERLKILSKHGTVSAECKQHSRCPL